MRHALLPLLLALAAAFSWVDAAAKAAAPCQVSGGGCLNVPGQPPRHVQATFGGTASQESGGTWQHVYRDGRTILFQFRSQDAVVSLCRPDPNGACRPPGMASRAAMTGTGTFTTATDSVLAEGNFLVQFFDKGSCEGEERDDAPWSGSNGRPAAE